ncbi:LysR family transcriptional regulator [Novosphingobium beihaiensis]|uniref:LysR family transcriptional regulator n=1 Tax=Novosphingobium beihaiensis TaxID=2930389 RepID=A0ABT0BK62_9SPHN|nr:LysR family transcriptional regulator [Novosphingobium beihaiensis]MCJ2185441.1 LysR family transcriptional regulator [Novosphingobium beihaiensis]
MTALTLGQLRTLDALVAEGSLQAAAARLGRTHPTLHTALGNMERAIGFKLFDRSGYRLELTQAGSAFHARARRVLAEMDELHTFAEGIAFGEETELHIVIGDLSPLPEMLGLIRSFFAAHPQTRLHLSFETLSAPWELLASGKADLILHHVRDGDARFETVHLRQVAVVPVAAPGFLPFPVAAATVERMRGLVQCVIRDSADSPAPHNYFVLDGARTYTVNSQMMKKEVILQGLGWGHMPDYLVFEELAAGSLIPITNKYFRGSKVELVAARQAGKPHGPIASKLWETLKRQPQPADTHSGS